VLDERDRKALLVERGNCQGDAVDRD